MSRPRTCPAFPDGYREYTGVVHLHSTYSDGHWPVGRILGEGIRAGLDFVFLTDHDTLGAKEDGWGGWYAPGGPEGPWLSVRPVERGSSPHRIFLGVGAEITPPKSHYLAFGVDRLPAPNLPSQKIIDFVRARGGLGIITHPDHRGNVRFGIGCYKWEDWSVTGYDALDVWDLMTDWQDSLRGIVSAYVAYNLPAWVLRGPKRETLARWDWMLARGPMPVIGCCDNHGRPYRLVRTYDILPYPTALRLLHLHLFTRPLEGLSADETERELLSAMRAGRGFIALDFWWPSRGFSFSAGNGTQTAPMGSTVSPENGPWTLTVRLPERGIITLVKDGVPLVTRVGLGLDFEERGGGVFRVEVHRRRNFWKKPWIFSNAIRITD
ncbi:MAG TPA: hypothetical protein VM054_07970 [bacterium]|nr:hypothetical protein [bacterium]